MLFLIENPRSGKVDVSRAVAPFRDALRNNGAFTIKSVRHLNAPSFSAAAIRRKRLARDDAALSGETVAIRGFLSAIVGISYRDYGSGFRRSPRESSETDAPASLAAGVPLTRDAGWQ